MNKTFNFEDFLNEKHGKDKEKDEEKEDKKYDSVDTIVMEVPLFIRMLEYAKEEAKTDMDLHKVAENALKLTKKTDKLSMINYQELITFEADKDDSKDKDDKDDKKDKKDKKDKE